MPGKVAEDEELFEVCKAVGEFGRGFFEFNPRVLIYEKDKSERDRDFELLKAIAKTIVVRRASDAYLFAVVPGDSQIAWPKLRAQVGVNKLKFPDAAEALAATGYERGTITPIGSEPEWPVLIDQRLVGCRVAMGAGAHGFSAFLDIDDLVRSYEAVVADLVD